MKLNKKQQAMYGLIEQTWAEHLSRDESEKQHWSKETYLNEMATVAISPTRRSGTTSLIPVLVKLFQPYNVLVLVYCDSQKDYIRKLCNSGDKVSFLTVNDCICNSDLPKCDVIITDEYSSIDEAWRIELVSNPQFRVRLK